MQRHYILLGFSHSKSEAYCEIKVLKSRELFGRDEVLIEPIRGKGSCWISENSIITLDQGESKP